jgi:hypothetical protein
MRIVIAVAVVLAALPCAALSCPFECGMTPGEGIMHFAAGAEPLELRSAPSSLAASAGPLGLAECAEIVYDEARCRTVSPGLLVAVADGVLGGWVYGPVSYLSRDDYVAFAAPAREFIVASGDTIEYLMYRAEGNFLARIGGEVVEVGSLPEERGLVRRVREPVVETWLRVVAPETGEPRGWLLVTDAVAELPRGL